MNDSHTHVGPRNRVALYRLVSVRAFFWWLFIYQKWPLKPAVKQSWALWYALKDLGWAVARLLFIPLTPFVGGLGMVIEKALRQRIVEGHARNATPRETADISGTISFR